MSQQRAEELQQQFEDQRRQIYRIAGLIGSLLILSDVAFVKPAALAGEPISVHVINDMAMALFTAVIVMLISRRRVTLEWAERTVLMVFAIDSLAINSIMPLVLNIPLAGLLDRTIRDTIWLQLIICALMLHLYRKRRGVVLALGFYAVSLGLLTAQILRGVGAGESTELGWSIIHIYMMGAVMICFLYVIALYRDQANLLHAEYTILAELAFSDPLTGLPNRRLGYKTLQSQIALTERSGRPLSVCLWDIDHFKQINDTFGHDAGDQVLRGIGQRLRGHLRESDLLARWGGEEFMVVLPESSLESALLVAERLRQAIATPPLVGGVMMTASFGVSTYCGGDTLDQLLRRADQALYVAKAEGRNRVEPATNALAENQKPSYASSSADGGRE